jgi:type II secretory pathway pseudopilin PulG
MDTGMPRPAGDTRSDQEGFIIIEVLVSAIILALVAGAVLTLITATTRSAASQRDRSVAYDLAQADQARLRTMKITTLNGLVQNNLERNEPIEANGATYTVESKGVYVNNQAGGISCTATNDTPDYIQLTSTVSSSALNHPVTIQSVVSPSSGSINTTLGNLAVQTVNAAEEPVAGVSVSLQETAYGRTTETQGCANFAEIPARKYKVLFSGNGTLINPKRETEETQTVEITGSETNRLFSKWDLPGNLEPEFVYVEPGTGELRPAPVDSMWVVPQTGGTGEPFGKASGPRSAKLVAEKLYPFKATKYTVYAGSCASNNPDPNSTKPENEVGLGSIEVLAGKTVTTQLHVPALELTVQGSTGEKISGATVTVTDENALCKSGKTGVERTFVTNAGGHLSNAPNGPTEAGLPFGTYKICVSKKIGSTTLHAEAPTVKVENFTKTGTVKTIALTTAGSECT